MATLKRVSDAAHAEPAVLKTATVATAIADACAIEPCMLFSSVVGDFEGRRRSLLRIAGPWRLLHTSGAVDGSSDANRVALLAPVTSVLIRMCRRIVTRTDEAFGCFALL
jgi:hypothetical protein